MLVYDVYCRHCKTFIARTYVHYFRNTSYSSTEDYLIERRDLDLPAPELRLKFSNITAFLNILEWCECRTDD